MSAGLPIGGDVAEAAEVATTVEPRLLTLAAAAKVLNVSEDTLRDLLNAGEIADIRYGRRRLVPTKAIDEYVDRQLAAWHAQRAAAS